MAGEIRREDVAIGFNIDYQKLEKVDAGIDKIVDKLGSLGHKFEPVNQQVKTFGTTFVDTIDKALGANKKLDASNSEVSKGIQNNSRLATTFRDKMANINSVTGSYTASQERHYHQVGTAMDQVTKHASILGKKLHDLPKETTAKVSFDTNGVQATDLTGQLHKVDKSMDKTAKKSRRLHDIIMGTFVGTAISNGIAGITNGLHEAAQAGMEYNKEQDTMKTVWTSLTTEAPKDGKNLVKYINSMSQHSIYAADTLNEMAQSFYHVHSNEKETKNWTNDFIALGSTLHMSNDALAESGEQFAKIVAGGKASSEDMAVMINRFPMFGEALQKATGKSMKQLYAMSAAGKLSAKQFTETLTYLGKKYEGSTKEAMTSFLGMSMYMKSRFSTLAGDVMKTAFNMDKKTASTMQDLLSDKMMRKYAEGISSALGVVTGAAVDGINYLDKHKDTILDVMKNLGGIAGTFGKEVWADSVEILTDIGDAFGLVDKNGKAAKDPLDQLDALLKGIDKHKEGIKIAARTMVGFFAVKKAAGFLKLLKEINTQLKISTVLNGIGSFSGIKTPTGKHYQTKKGRHYATNPAIANDVDIAQAISESGTNAGRRFAKEAKKGGTSAGKTGGRHFSSRVKSAGDFAGKHGGKQFSGAIKGLAWADMGTSIGGNALGAFSDGISTKKGGKQLWKAGGAAVGGGFGLFLSGGNPIVADAMSKLGEGIAEAIADSPFWTNFKKFLNNPSQYLNKNHKSEQKNVSKSNSRDKRHHRVQTVSPSAGFGAGAGSDIGGLSTGYANGGLIARNGMAMVGEAGTEIGYDARKGTYQIYDHGPQLVHLTAGMHIMNHRDSLKAMRGGLGRNRVLPGYAKGTGAVGSASVDTTVKVKGVNDATMKNTEYKTKRSADKIGSDITKGYAKGTKGAHGKLTGFNKQSDRLWKTNQSETNKRTDQIRKGTIADFDAAQKGADKQLIQLKNQALKTMDKLQNGMSKADQTIVSDFGSNFGKLPGLAKSAMKGAITSLNGGFTGIDSALSQFGGNKQVLRPIHYATGSNGPIDSDQLAVLNDATAGPRQELVGRGDQLLKPIGDNVAVHLKKGDSVFNGAQVERAKPYLPHFKKGTGASDSKLRSLASSNASDSSKAFSQEFTVNVKANGANLQKGLTSTASAGAKTVGVPWENAMWGYIESLINSGGGVGGGPVLHSPGAGWMKTSGFGNRGAVGGGFSSHDGNDFSGAKVVHAMQDAVVTRVGGAPSGWGGGDGIGEFVATKGGNLSLIYQELNGKSNSGANILVHKGEHVKQGQAIAKLGPSGTHVHVGASTEGLWSHGGGSTRGWLDVTKLHSSFGNSESKKSEDKPKVSKAMTSLVKSQLGPTAVKWIKKNLQDSIGDADIGNLSGSMTHRAKALAAAIKKMYGSATNAGIAAVLGNWEFESGLNPSAVNPGGGASGLGQWLGGRKTALINYSKRHGKNWKSAEAQLEFALKGDGSDSSVLKSVLRGSGSVASLANKFSSQWERGGYNAQHVAGARKIEAALHDDGGWSKKGKLNIFGEKSKEVAINPRKVSADGLIDSAIKARSKVDGSGLAGTLNQVLSSKPTSRVQPAKVAGSAGGRNVTIKMTNNIKIEGAGDGSEIKKSVETGLQSSSEKLIDMVRRAIGTDQGREGFVI